MEVKLWLYVEPAKPQAGFLEPLDAGGKPQGLATAVRACSWKLATMVNMNAGLGRALGLRKEFFLQSQIRPSAVP